MYVCMYRSMFPSPGMLTAVGGVCCSPYHRGGRARLGRPWPDGWDGCCDTVTCPWRVIALGAAGEAVTPLERGAPAVPCGESTGAQTRPCQTEGHKRSPSRVVEVFFGSFFSSKAAGS